MINKIEQLAKQVEYNGIIQFLDIERSKYDTSDYGQEQIKWLNRLIRQLRDLETFIYN